MSSFTSFLMSSWKLSMIANRRISSLTSRNMCLHTPLTVMLDPLPAMTQLLDRFASYRIMNKLQNSLRDRGICSPPYLEINTSDQVEIRKAVEKKQLNYPLICKTRVAHGSRSHEVSVVMSQFVLMLLCTPLNSWSICVWIPGPPCVLQSFVNHGAVLHKVFVVGEAHFTVERPSLKNFPLGPCDRKTIFFNSHEVSKPESCSHLTALDDNTPRLPPPSGDVMVALVKELRAELGMALFGVDTIVNIHTRTLTIIDINIFPGYEGVPQFFSSLLSHIESVLKHRGTVPPPREPSPLPVPPICSRRSGF
ncbi:hypothetical protein SKAU_G00091060 [Synaphobranchus kaupii]|uniref:Inositol-tetrakisphosphate 1-kinase n=1 Tax=Synaphobranchus kaupii TaxID=118154 RepID=A0A9Q1J6H6_SYNKA|nr:hypothetical protein SKAU_G00091060 [Synaphobranchus kaupii]